VTAAHDALLAVAVSRDVIATMDTIKAASKETNRILFLCMGILLVEKLSFILSAKSDMLPTRGIELRLVLFADDGKTKRARSNAAVL